MNRVLLIEDNDDDIELTRRTFEKAGLPGEVRIARDGQDALDCLFGQGLYRKDGPASSIRLILLDLNLPKMPGLEVLKQLRLNASTREIPIMILTISKKEPDLLQSFTMGITDYIIKPLSAERFAQIYRKYVEGPGA